MPEELPLNNQPTEMMPAVKPPTVNSLIVEQMRDIEGLVVFLARIVTIRNLTIMVLIVALLNVALSVYLLTAVSILFGRTLP
jgi:hypothetical protein